MACGPSARNPAPSASMCWSTEARPCTGPVKRSAALAAALAKAQAELVNPEKSLTATIRRGRNPGRATELPLCAALERPRHRAQDARRSKRSRPCRPPPSTRPPAWSV